MATFAVLFLNARALRIAWHVYQLERIREEIYAEPSQITNDGLVGYGDGDLFDRYEHHRRELVALGHLVKRKFSLRRIRVPSEEAKHFYRELNARRCPEYVDYESPYPDEPEPMRLVVWCYPEHAAAWDAYIASRDIPDYRSEFMRRPNEERNTNKH